jgi:hypothetical protein
MIAQRLSHIYWMWEYRWRWCMFNKRSKRSQPQSSTHCFGMDGILTSHSAKHNLQRLRMSLKKQQRDKRLTADRFVVDDWDITNWFLDHGANPNTACRLDLTPMSFAV